MNFIGKTKRNSVNYCTLNLSSMIDVTFLLLIYFIVTTVIATPEDALSPALKSEKSTNVVQDNFEPQIIVVKSIENQPAYQMGDRTFLDRGKLAKFLEQLPKQPGLIFRVDDNVSVGFALAALQEARNAGFEKVTYVPSSD